MPAACALGMISGKIIFNFEIAERLRTLRYLIFTGGVVKENGICSAASYGSGGAAGNTPSGAKPEGVCTLSHKKRAYGRGKAVHCAKNTGFLLPNGGKRAIL